jgi:hypothetical protein
MPYDFIPFGIPAYPIGEEFADLKWNLKKMFMFSGVLFKYEWVVCLDLDLVITGMVDFLTTHRSENLVTCRAAYSDDVGGSVVGFDPRQPWCDSLFTIILGAREVIESRTKGSERKFYRYLKENKVITVEYWQDLYPGKINSYKVDGYTSDASIVRFHGKPRPHQVDHSWVKENWR